MNENQLWNEFREKADTSAREALILKYQGLVTRISATLYGKRLFNDIEFADYTQLGTIGLIESIDRYDSAKGAAFETYASYRIRGAILNGLAKLTEKRDQNAYLAKAKKDRIESLSDGLASSGRRSELFDEIVDITVEVTIALLLTDSGFEAGHESYETDAPFHNKKIHQIKRDVRAAVDRLPEKERIVVSYHYFHHVNFETVAEILDLTKGRVSQIHKNAMRLIRKELGRDITLDHYL